MGIFKTEKKRIAELERKVELLLKKDAEQDLLQTEQAKWRDFLNYDGTPQKGDL